MTNGHGATDNRTGDRAVAHRAADRDRRRGRAGLRRGLRALRPRQRRLAGRGPRTVPGRAADLARAERAIHGPGRRRFRQSKAAPPDHDRHVLHRPRKHEHGDGCGGGPRQPPAGPAHQRRHLPTPHRRPRAATGRTLRQPVDHGERCLQAGDPVLGSHHSTGTDRAVAPPGPRHDARPGRLRTGLPRAAPGRSRPRRTTIPSDSSPEQPTTSGARARTLATSLRPQRHSGAPTGPSSSPAAVCTTPAPLPNSRPLPNAAISRSSKRLRERRCSPTTTPTSAARWG